MDKRQTPEQLLNKYETQQRGKLTLFLGAAAGVGKTYAMLKALPELLADKVDVVIGYIETHQRSETAELIPSNIEIIPLQQIVHKGHRLTELDVDTILLRKPQLVLIDELAHSNVDGSRNTKRYQDVIEILDAGIDVYSAVNIQHIESLNDVVAQITGIKVNETIPDFMVENANEIKLIDVTPDELIDRLKDGKIYPSERALKALDNFFRKGNLTALREMALLKTAQKVEQQVQEYRNDQSIDQIWASHEKLMVVVEPGYSSEKIIRSGKTMFDKGFSQWFVVYIDNNELEDKSLREREKLLALLNLAQELGAETSHLSGNNSTEVIVDFAREHNINTVVLSQYRLSLYYRLFGTTLVAKLSELAPELNLHLIRDETTRKPIELQTLQQKNALDWSKLFRKALINLVLFAGLGLFLSPLDKIIANENILMVYLLVIIAINHGRGKLSAIIAALVATISFDFFFIPPRFSFAIGDGQYFITFMVMAVVAIAFNVVNGNLRYQVSALRKTQRQMRLLYESSKKLAEAMVESQVSEVVQDYLPRLLDVNFNLLLPTLEENLVNQSTMPLAKIDLAIAQWVFNNGQRAGLNTSTFAGNQYHYVAINAQIRTRGVLIVEPHNPVEFFLPAAQELLANFVSNVATTLERVHFTQIAIQTEVLLAKQKQAHG